VFKAELNYLGIKLNWVSTISCSLFLNMRIEILALVPKLLHFEKKNGSIVELHNFNLKFAARNESYGKKNIYLSVNI
jgi:hypothetical protein